MFDFSPVLARLQAVIAARAARDRSMTVLLVALWGRIARMGTRLERWVALWRAGKLPKARAPRDRGERVRAPRGASDIRFPNKTGWLRERLGHDVGPFGARLQALLTEAECEAFLAACPQAGRVLRPLLRMLTFDALPEVVRLRAAPVAVEQGVIPAGVVVALGIQNLRG